MQPKLKRSMGLWMATALVVGNMIGSGVFLLPAFAYSVRAIAGSGQDIIAKGFVLLLAGVPIYVGMRWWQQREAGPDAVDLVPPVVDGAAKEPGEVRIRRARRDRSRGARA